MNKVFIFTFAFLVAASPAFAKVVVLDGDSIIVDNSEIRLIGLDAPEHGQVCFDKDDKEYNCGEEAKTFLKKLVKGKEVTCRKIAKDIYKRDLSECFANDININIELLKSGWAVLYRGNDSDYVKAEAFAKEHGNGLWQGRFMKPEFHRILNPRKKKRKN